ncbi:putative histone deacetylase 1, 2,3 [Blastocladiella britannica]|nr:putative histone deacetylase 1, 2,3 [Blastocladiella britannica]
MSPQFRYIPSSTAHRKDRVSYFYDDDVSTIYYGKHHPMKPQRMTLTHDLVMAYQLDERMDIFQPRLATEDEIKQFHVSEYVDFLRTVTPDNQSAFKDALQRFNVGDDCPIFSDLYKFCRISAGGSLEAARRINAGSSDIAINWSGGLHHAKKIEASGFCYVNDIVLCIMELLRFHGRVLYIDIDVHHGDGVQDAFIKTDRVMTVSFHRYGPTGDGGEFFPGTGALEEIGKDRGKYYAINVPLKAGMDDSAYLELFKAVMDEVMVKYNPGAVVLQCGADSLGGDRLGTFCLSIAGHGECVAHMKRKGVPLVVLGGGGYTIRNVARAWANETALLCNAKLPNDIPPHQYYNFYGPDHKLHPRLAGAQARNENSAQDLQRIKEHVFEQLRRIAHAPSVQMHHPPPSFDVRSEEGDAAALEALQASVADKRNRIRTGPAFGMRAHGTGEGEWYDDEADQDDQGGGEDESMDVDK